VVVVRVGTFGGPLSLFRLAVMRWRLARAAQARRMAQTLHLLDLLPLVVGVVARQLWADPVAGPALAVEALAFSLLLQAAGLATAEEAGSAWATMAVVAELVVVVGLGLAGRGARLTFVAS